MADHHITISSEDLKRYGIEGIMSRSQIARPRMESPTLRESQSYGRYPEGQEQMHVYRNELRKKDDIIRDLTATRQSQSQCISTSHCAPVADKYSSNSMMQETIRLRSEVDKLTADLAECRNTSESRCLEIKRLEMIVESHSDNEQRHMAIIDALKTRVIELDEESNCLQGSNHRNQSAVDTMNIELDALRRKNMEYEERLKKHLEIREEAEHNFAQVSKKYDDLILQLKSTLQIEETRTDDTDFVIKQFAELVQQNCLSQTKITRLQEEVQNLRIEESAARETITRMVTEVTREQKSVLQQQTETEKIRLEKDEIARQKMQLEAEVQSVHKRINQVMQERHCERQEMEQKVQHYEQKSQEIRESSYKERTVVETSKKFYQSIAAILSDKCVLVQDTEEDIIKYLKFLREASDEKDMHINRLKSQYETLRAKHEDQSMGHKSSSTRAECLEQEVCELKARLRQCESEISASEVTRCGLKTDREKYLQFLEIIMKSLKMEAITADCGLEMSCDAILARAEQLTKLECEALAGRSSQMYSLQRKLKSYKEQVESKDLHLDLLRKKVSQLEDRAAGRCELERERDCESMNVTKMERLVERYRREIESQRCEMRDLKAQLLNDKDCHVTPSIDCAVQSELSEMRSINDKQARQISQLKRDLERRGQIEDSVLKNNKDAAIKHLTEEIRQLKIALEETRGREQELLDQRQVIGRMLGLEVNGLAIPAYELIERLRRLVEANHANYIVRTSSVDNIVESMDDAYRAGYESGEKISYNPNRLPYPTKQVSHAPMRQSSHHYSSGNESRYRANRPTTTLTDAHTKRKLHKTRGESSRNRARSVSPSRKVDPKVY